jgi:hypothetical protein
VKKMSKSEKSRGAAPKQETTLDQVFAALEERVERLSARLAEQGAENRRLREALEEAGAASDRHRAELEEAREQLAADAQTREETHRFQEERELLRERIERLIKSLEDGEAPEA